MRSLAIGFMQSRALYAAAVLDLAGQLASGPKDAHALAHATGTHGPTLYRLLRALASSGVFVEGANGAFSNTSMSELLRSDVPGSMRAMVLLFGDETCWRSWELLLYSVRTGEPAFDHLYGMGAFEYRSRHPDKGKIFDEAMVAVSTMVNDALVASVDFSGTGTLVDVAGGYGATLCALLEANPSMRGVLFDMPHVLAGAKDYIARHGLSDRCEVVGGSFFESVPAGGDAYFMKHIIHDWGDEDCIRILRNCRAALRPDAKLLVCERVIPPGNEPFSGKWSDLHMLVENRRGRERTESEYRQLLEAGGFRLHRVVPTHSPWSVVEAVGA